MNLRQKAKQAKKGLEIVDKEYSGSTSWDIYQDFMKKSELNKIIDYKRKPSRPFKWNEEYEIDFKKPTYMRFQADSSELVRLESPNGKPLTDSQLIRFMNDSIIKLRHHGLKVSLEDANDEMYTSYVLYISNDRKKQKRFHIEELYKQYHGDNQLYWYNDLLKLNK